MTLKEKFMNEMMESQFKNMSSEDKKQMMEAMISQAIIQEYSGRHTTHIG